MESIGQHPSIVELLGQDRVDHVLIMELGNADLYKVVKKMKADKGVPECIMGSWASCIFTGALVCFLSIP